MKQLLIAICICMMLLFSPTLESRAYAQPSILRATLPIAATAPEKDLIGQLENDILPQLQNIFTPEQQEKFKTQIASGVSFRKAFKSITLTPDQKASIKTLLKSIPKKDAFASLTPEQKKQLFLKKKDILVPTSDEIIEKINTGLKIKGVSLPEGVKEKIDAGLKKKDAFMPTTEVIPAQTTPVIDSPKKPQPQLEEPKLETDISNE